MPACQIAKSSFSNKLQLIKNFFPWVPVLENTCIEVPTKATILFFDIIVEKVHCHNMHDAGKPIMHSNKIYSMAFISSTQLKTKSKCPLRCGIHLLGRGLKGRIITAEQIYLVSEITLILKIQAFLMHTYTDKYPGLESAHVRPLTPIQMRSPDHCYPL